MVKNFRVLRTSFLVKEDETLKQVLTVQVDNSGPVASGYLVADVAGTDHQVSLPEIRRGLNHYQVRVPEVSGPTPARFALQIGEDRVEFQTTLDKVRHWQIYLIPFSHHDLGYTDQPEVCIQQHKKYFGSIIDYCRQTADFPEEAKFRWTCDTTWAVKYFLQDAPDKTMGEFFDLVRDGRIEITAQYAAFNSALLTHEELIRSIYYAHGLAERHGFQITSAMTTDIPGNPWGFPQVLAKSGVRYLSTAVNEQWSQDGVARARVPRISKPFYWSSPDGSRVLVWNSDPEYIYCEGLRLGFTESYEQVYKLLPPYLRAIEEKGFPFDALHLRTTCKTCDNAPPCVFLSRIVREWNTRWAYPKLVVATNTQFFQHMEETYADQFPLYSGDWTDWWIDGPGSSAYETGINRASHEILASAEKLAALSSLAHEDGEYPRAEIEQAYDNLMLYDEHTWGMWNNVTDPYLPTTSRHWVVKAKFAEDAARLSHELLNRGLQTLGQAIGTGESPVVVVFNPLSWPRSGIASLKITDDIIDKSRPFQLMSEAGKPLASQTVESHTGKGGLTIACLAEDVPPVGYRAYQVAYGRAAKLSLTTAKYGDNTLENRFYKVAMDPVTGGITNIFDKELQVELVDRASPYRLNQYIYDSGEPPINGRFSPESAQIHQGAHGPLWSSLVAVTKCKIGKHVKLSDPHWGRGKLAPNVTPWIRQEVILYEDIKRIDLVNRVFKEETLEKEGVYYAFPFLVENGQFKLEIAGAVMRPGVDQLPDSGHDWHSVGYWLDISGPDYGVTWSSREVPVVSIGDINTGKWQTRLDLRNTTFFAYAMNNYWTTNFKESQGGDFTFRFSLTSHGSEWDNAQATRFGWDYCTELFPVALPAGQKGDLDRIAHSFCQVDSPNVMLLALKKAEDGDGFIVRLLELLGQRTVVQVGFPKADVSQAYRTDIVERNIESLRVTDHQVEVNVPPFGIETIRVRAR